MKNKTLLNPTVKPRSDNDGFTLIEILIALTILSIALTAIIKSTSQNIKDTYYLQQKTVATWIGTEVVNEGRLQLIAFPFEKEKKVLGEDWLVKGSLIETPNPRIQEIHVHVFRKNDETQWVQLKSYLYVQ